MPNPMDLSVSASGIPGYYNTDGQWYRDDGTPVIKIDIVADSSGSVQDQVQSGRLSDSVEQWARDNGYRMHPDTKDILYNQFFNEKDTRSAWERTMTADNTKYQRAVADMKAAGLNPFLLMSGGASGAGTSSPGSVGSGSISALRSSKNQKDAQNLSSILQIIGSISQAVLMGILLKK